MPGTRVLRAGQRRARARAGAIPVLVYNPHPYPLDAVIECEFQLPDISIEETFFDIAVLITAGAACLRKSNTKLRI